MNLRQVYRLLVAASLVYLSGAFLPNYVGVTLPITDYTLTEITVQGIVRAVARYFEDTNPDLYNPGDLTGLDPLTPSRLFKKHYGDCVYSTKFEGAIKAILDENVRISDKFFHKAVWHFNGNLINKGNSKMVSLRKTLLKDLLKGDENAPDYDLARVHSGQFLHMAQSFYSNTNWIELNRWLNSQDKIVPLLELGIIKPLSWHQSPASVEMCQSCTGGTTSPDLQDCSNNLRGYVFYLTSGYRDGQDITKPVARPGIDWGQCSHGGINDASWTTVATGGINKESSDPKLSPHHDLHEQAALTALQATEDFFYHPDTGLYKLIGEQKFRKLLNLDVGTSLTFVVDTTGSMSDDIEAVKEETIRIVDLHAGTCLAASKYVVAPFNDPGVGPASVTSDSQECIDFLGTLTASGGGDCPENANSGMELGIQNSLNGAKVYVFTDADDKDKEKLPDVLALIKEKEVQVTFFLTGACASRRKKRATDLLEISSSYDEISSSSGGEIYETDKAGISDLAKIIEGDIRASQVTITKRSSMNQTSFDVDIPVDSTIQEVLVSVVGNLDSDTVFLSNPQGVTGKPGDLGVDVFTQSADQTVFSINATSAEAKGTWVLMLENLDLFVEYRVLVSANSFLDFTFDFLEVNERGMAYPLDGKLVAGAEVLIMVQVSAPENVASVNAIRLHDTNGMKTLLTASAEAVAGLTEGIFKAQIAVPEEPFFVSIVGEDTQSMEFLRTKPSEFQVVKFKLEQVPGTDTLDELIPGGVANLTFRLANTGPADNLTISVSILDGANSSARSISAIQPVVTASVVPSAMMLGTGESEEGQVTVAAADDAPTGSSVKITLTVASGSSAALNFLSLDATVFEAQNETDDNPDEDDHTPPTCTILATGGGCTANQMSQECHLHEWWVRFQATDESIVTEVSLDPEVGESQTLVYEEFSLNATTAKYNANCCCPTINITAKDGAGNTASCGKDYYDPVSDQIDRPVCNGPDNPDKDDNTPPTCTILATGGGCTANQMSQECHLHEWWARFQATDESIVTEVSLDPEVGESQTLVYEEFSFNATTAKYTANCCCPTITITAKDGAGNTASCGKDYYDPVSDQIDRPVCNGPILVTEGLSTAVIVGIAVGSVAAAVILILGTVCVIKSCTDSGKAMGSVRPLMVAPSEEPIPLKEAPQGSYENQGKI